MWPFKKKPSALNPKTKRDGRPTRCATPLIQMNRNNPNFLARCAYKQEDGTTITEDLYPCDGYQEIRVVSGDEGSS